MYVIGMSVLTIDAILWIYVCKIKFLVIRQLELDLRPHRKWVGARQTTDKHLFEMHLHLFVSCSFLLLLLLLLMFVLLLLLHFEAGTLSVLFMCVGIVWPLAGSWTGRILTWDSYRRARSRFCRAWHSCKPEWTLLYNKSMVTVSQVIILKMIKF